MRKSVLHRFVLSIGTILALASSFACARQAVGMEQEVLLSLFKSHEPFNTIFLKGPLRLQKTANTALGTGIFKVSCQNGKFQIVSLRQNQNQNQAVIISSHELTIAAQGAAVTIGVSATALRPYRGEINLTNGSTGMLCRNRVAMKDYINSVVGSETLIDFPPEALKAHSVLIQTAMQRYKRNDELNDSTDKQAYFGESYVRASVRDAVAGTWGETLNYKGHPLPIYFHSACAGGTSSSELFTGKISQIPADVPVKCEYCKKSPFWKPTRHEIPATLFASKFPSGVPQITRKDVHGRPLQLSFSSTQAETASTQSTTGYDFWLKVGQRLGWDKMPGTRFQVKKLASGNVELISTGAGHGVGLCQWGAAELARQGKTYREILQFYFPGASLARNK
jgi:stage II sporulation protein D